MIFYWHSIIHLLTDTWTSRGKVGPRKNGEQEKLSLLQPLYTDAWRPLTNDKIIMCLVKKPDIVQVHITLDFEGLRTKKWMDKSTWHPQHGPLSFYPKLEGPSIAKLGLYTHGMAFVRFTRHLEFHGHGSWYVCKSGCCCCCFSSSSKLNFQTHEGCGHLATLNMIFSVTNSNWLAQ